MTRRTEITAVKPFVIKSSIFVWEMGGGGSRKGHRVSICISKS